jgi:two-component system chemotaxis sensor kinase CheA
VLERLNDPLVHLIRNSIDHGVELPDVREANGKSRVGTILLSAAQSGDKVVITVKDDGAGLNEEAIRAKAIEKKLIDPNSDIHGRELFNLIFAPGFSTAKVVSSISGRGVGMDVVKREIDSLRGTVDITSAPGKGTVISISLPLTLAIIDGLMVQVADSSFVVPLSFVEECVELSLDDRSKSHGRQLAYVRGEIVPYLRLRGVFGMDDSDNPIEHIVIVRVEDKRVGIVVDNVVGDYQTVIKSLGNAYKEADTVSGATIMGDGKVALIVDVVKLVQSAELEAVSNCAA